MTIKQLRLAKRLGLLLALTCGLVAAHSSGRAALGDCLECDSTFDSCLWQRDSSVESCNNITRTQYNSCNLSSGSTLQSCLSTAAMFTGTARTDREEACHMAFATSVQSCESTRSTSSTACTTMGTQMGSYCLNSWSGCTEACAPPIPKPTKSLIMW